MEHVGSAYAVLKDAPRLKFEVKPGLRSVTGCDEVSKEVH